MEYEIASKRNAVAATIENIVEKWSLDLDKIEEACSGFDNILGHLALLDMAVDAGEPQDMIRFRINNIKEDINKTVQKLNVREKP